MKLTSAIPGLVALIVATGVLAQTPATPSATPAAPAPATPSATPAAPAPAAAPVAQPLLQTVLPEMYPKLSDEQRQFYVAGILDYDQEFFPQTKSMFAACLKGMTISQVTAIVDHGLATLEPKLRASMPITVHNAIVIDCNHRGFQIS